MAFLSLLLRRLLPFAALLVAAAGPLRAQRAGPLETPLPPDLLRLLADEVSGELAFHHLMKLAGAPWLRSREELTGASTFHESGELLRLARGYGIETIRLDRYEAPGTFEYPLEGELWVEGRRLARIPADPALVASGSRSGEVEGPLVYVPEIPPHGVPAFQESAARNPEGYRGAVALMWSHPRGALFEALDRAGVRAVIAFNARERYLDPDQVVYSSGPYAQGQNLRMGFSVSWRQWSELLEDLQRGITPKVKGRVVMESFPNRFETVYAWIPGTEPELPGVVFTAHLFEGYTKRGANDNAGGPAIQLEILRALHHLIATGRLPRPRRTLHFLWPNEISGTYEFIRREPELLDRWAVNINMDMVSEGLRKNNSVFTMSETPAHLPSFYDGLAASILNYLWRTNDIVYLPDSPRGRPGGQYFPEPLWEKNGSRDAFRFFIHEATGGSDHIVFNNPSVRVPGIEFFTWPDQWYHADKDLPENADPTQMRRVAFVGAATAWACVALTDELLPSLLDWVSDFGYRRVAERAIPRAMAWLDQATGPDPRLRPDEALLFARSVLEASVSREMDAVASVRSVYSGSGRAEAWVAARLKEWEGYREGLERFLLAAASARGFGTLRPPAPSAEERRLAARIPRLAPGIRGVETSLQRYAPYRQWMEAHGGEVEALGLTNGQMTQILNFVDGRRSLGEIVVRVRAATGEPLSVAQAARYLEILQEVGWIGGT